MFRRRARKSTLTLLRETVWPRIGWHRTSQYLWHRLHCLPGTPYSIAAGLACGTALSVTPLVGIHFFLAALLAWMIRGNVLASAFGTVVGNPWTFPIIWMGTYHLGKGVMGHGISWDAELDFTAMFTGMVQSMIEADAVLFMDQVWPVWLPMFVGCVPLSILTWLVTYVVFYRLTESYQRRRRAKRATKRAETVDQNTTTEVVP